MNYCLTDKSNWAKHETVFLHPYSALCRSCIYFRLRETCNVLYADIHCIWIKFDLLPFLCKILDSTTYPCRHHFCSRNVILNLLSKFWMLPEDCFHDWYFSEFFSSASVRTASAIAQYRGDFAQDKGDASFIPEKIQSKFILITAGCAKERHSP